MTAAMLQLAQKDIFTTGEVAQICNVSQQTIIRCFDNGRLKGYRVPGSRFRRIPRESLLAFMKENEIPIDHLAGSEPSASTRHKILIVDDDIAIIEMFRDLLGREGRFDIATAQTGYEAGILTERMKPDIVLLDFKLPDLNGTDICRNIRKNDSLHHAKIIMISGVADRDEIEELYRAGADKFIRKPFQIGEVINTINELLMISA